MASALKLSSDMDYDIESLCSTKLSKSNIDTIDQDPSNVSVTPPPYTTIYVDAPSLSSPPSLSFPPSPPSSPPLSFPPSPPSPPSSPPLSFPPSPPSPSSSPHLSHLYHPSLTLPTQFPRISRHKWEYAYNNFVPTMKSKRTGHLQMLVESEYPWSYYLCKRSEGYYKKIYYKKMLMKNYNIEKTFSYYSQTCNKQERIVTIKITRHHHIKKN